MFELPEVRATVERDRGRWIALTVLCVGALMIVLDPTIVTVALPSIQVDLGFSQSALTWVINAYLIAFGSLLLLAGRLGDLIGRKRVFLVGLSVFTASSLLCGLASSPPVLIGARFVQGIGAALTSAVALDLLRERADWHRHRSGSGQAARPRSRPRGASFISIDSLAPLEAICRTELYQGRICVEHAGLFG
jgi:MFS family permease